MEKEVTLKTELEKTMKLFMEENCYLEVRILNTKRGTVSGYYNNVEEMYKHIKQYDGKNNIFFTLNKIVDGLEARSVNRLKEYTKDTTKDSEIADRKWILVDLDPVRPAGISSTKEELERANSMAEEIKKYLTSVGFSEPVKALSGNGYHLLYPINMPNDKESTLIVKTFLEILDKRFSTQEVKVDITNFNAARITKLYGTMACKGDSTKERLHRHSKILSEPKGISPKGISPVLVCSLLAVIEENKTEKEEKMMGGGVSTKKVQKSEADKMDFSLESWLNRKKIPAARTKPWEGGEGVCYVLEECPWNPEHSKDKGAYIIQHKNGTISAGCHHDSCKEKNVNWASLWKKKEKNKPLPNIRKTEEVSDYLKDSSADILLKMVEENKHVYFRNQLGDTYVQVPIENTFVNYPLNSEIYKKMLRRMYYNMTKKCVRKETIQQVVETLMAKASFEGKEYEVYKRFAMYNEKLYYYLADTENTIFCISKESVKICKDAPIRLIKRKSMLEQPMPIKGKNFMNMMRKYYHFESIEDEILHDVILVTRLVTNIEQPIVIYTGVKGSSKTTSMDLDKRCLDLSSNNVTIMPKNEEDFLLTLDSQDIVCLDNIDRITKSQADIFCQAVTGATAVKRKKYTDRELCEVRIKSTIYITGINLLSERSDFLDRCIFLNTKPFTSEIRKSKSQVLEEFEKDKPYILYELFTVLSKAMKIYSEVELQQNDRLLDFLKWGCAIAKAIGYKESEFLQAYRKNRRGIDEELLANDEVANAVLLYLEKKINFMEQ